MKGIIRSLTMVVCVSLTVFVSPKTQAGEEIGEQEKDLAIGTFITVNNDWKSPEEGDSYLEQSSFFFWYKDWLGGGFDVKVKPEFDYLRVRPFVTVQKGPWYLVAGLTTDSNDSEYAQAGLWYLGQFGKLKVLGDLRSFWNIDGGQSTDYLDCFVELDYPLWQKWYLGIDLTYDHYMQKEDHDWYLVGPYVRYEFNKHLSLFLRYSRSWDVFEGDSTEEDALRIKAEICF